MPTTSFFDYYVAKILTPFLISLSVEQQFQFHRDLDLFVLTSNDVNLRNEGVRHQRGQGKLSSKILILIPDLNSITVNSG
jgi:hypothetical protein